MPVYEFFCPTCRKKSSSFVRTPSTFKPKCVICGSSNVTRVISAFAYHRSFDPGESASSGNLERYKDPRNIGRWVEKKFKDMDMDLPTGLKQKIEAAREGELPEPVKDLQSASPDASYH